MRGGIRFIRAHKQSLTIVELVLAKQINFFSKINETKQIFFAPFRFRTFIDENKKIKLESNLL